MVAERQGDHRRDGATLDLTSQVHTTIKVGDKFTVLITPSDGTLTGAVFTSTAATIKTVGPITLA